MAGHRGAEGKENAGSRGGEHTLDGGVSDIGHGDGVVETSTTRNSEGDGRAGWKEEGRRGRGRERDEAPQRRAQVGEEIHAVRMFPYFSLRRLFLFFLPFRLAALFFRRPKWDDWLWLSLRLCSATFGCLTSGCTRPSWSLCSTVYNYLVGHQAGEVSTILCTNDPVILNAA